MNSVPQPAGLASGEPSTNNRIVPYALAGLSVAVTVAYVSARTILRAWAACDDGSSGDFFGLNFGQVPAVIVVAEIAWVLAAYVTRARSHVVRLLAALGLALVVGWVSIAVRVPMYEPGYYAAAGAPNAVPPLTQCGSNGVPTWWPTWLPN